MKLINYFLIIFPSIFIISMMILLSSGQALNQPATAKFFALTSSQRTIESNIYTSGRKILINNGQIIGNSFIACTRIGRDGTFGANVEQCSVTFNLPRGKIVAVGSRNSREKYSLVVTGGTGFYNNVGGKLDVFQLGDKPRLERLIFTLVP